MALSRFRQVKSADEEANLLERAVPKSTRYKEPVGINMLNNILPSLCKEATFKRNTSHYLRVTCAPSLFNADVEEN